MLGPPEGGRALPLTTPLSLSSIGVVEDLEMDVEKRADKISGVPAILWGSRSNKVYVCVHGQGGNKEEAELLASIACRRGWQVIGFDLPEHGDRKRGGSAFAPWHVVPELSHILSYIKERWTEIALFASSIGAWFSLLSFSGETFKRCLFVSPVLDMKHLMANRMLRAGVSEERLKREHSVPTSFGEALSWEYWTYVLDHPIVKWETPTSMLYAENDDLVPFDTVQHFAQEFNAAISVMKQGEHWFHTPRQIDYLRQWLDRQVKHNE